MLRRKNKVGKGGLKCVYNELGRSVGILGLVGGRAGRTVSEGRAF